MFLPSSLLYSRTIDIAPTTHTHSERQYKRIAPSSKTIRRRSDVDTPRKQVLLAIDLRLIRVRKEGYPIETRQEREEEEVNTPPLNNRGIE